ncbi:dienelactone hydrolase family protein [Paraburkholderia oxyphila]|uniref:dienelactone hydrolase family protein n=1 Tax=Paraburkholderia oxyphila TaxID=614212 RepID=UPI000488D2A6|nr:dienelactone hydrolase family protein [Paraburkholderia oxyphila]
MSGTTISISEHGNTSFTGYLALPPSGSGPGLILCQEIFGVNAHIREVAELYAQEGYVVLAPDFFWRQAEGCELEADEAGMLKAMALVEAFRDDEAVEDLHAALAVLRARPEVTGDCGVVGFCLGGKLAYLAAAHTDAAVCVGYYGVGIEHLVDRAHALRGRLVLHFAGNDAHCNEAARATIFAALGQRDNVSLYVYHGVDHAFARFGSPHFNKSASTLAHDRTIGALRRVLGPHYDLEALWERHLQLEFETRDADATMQTMVAEPYVNHVPTMTGGVGYASLRRFYQHHFIHANPPDTRQIPVSRTVGATQIVDEILFCFTHTREIDWLLPGIAPTGRQVEIPLVGIVKFRGDKLCHEHIYWDQASVLVQIGLIDAGELPVAGMEAARKVMDETLPSNTLMNRWSESEMLSS